MAKSLKSFLQKNYPDSTNTDIIDQVQYIDTKIPSLNYVMSGLPFSGGLPLSGKITVMFGPEGCLVGDTFIQYSLKSISTGKIFNHKGGTIKRLYERFHNICNDGRVNKIDFNDTEFYINSIDEKTNRIIRQPIADVVKTGVKECFEVCTSTGKRNRITKDHYFYIGNGEYKQLKELNVGDIVYIHNNTTNKKINKKNTIKRKSIMVKYHPSERFKIIDNKYKYCRVQYSHIIYEANINNMTVEDYINILNKESIDYIKKLYTIPSGYVIHHIDENPLNNNINNLELINAKKHDKYHSLNNIENLSFIVTEDKIDSITSIGEHETYDIKCFEPYNNYIADGIVVHNSGKTSFVVYLISQIQKAGIDVVYIDTERSITIPRLKQFGVNYDDLIYIMPETMEECFDIIESIYNERVANMNSDPILIIWDSVAMTPTADEISRTASQKEIASQANVLTRNLKRIKGKIRKINAGLFLINQARANQSGFGDIFTMPGGYALRHSADMILRINRVKPDETGQTIKITTPTKNKLFRPFQKTDLRFEYVEGFTKENNLDAFCDFLKNIEILGQAGAWCYLESDVEKLIKEENLSHTEATKNVNKFYKKDFVQKMLDDQEYYDKMLKESEEYVNQNISKVAKLMLDETIDTEHIDDNDGSIVK